jgi:RNA polymerase sigma factor (sigma-70 family)
MEHVFGPMPKTAEQDRRISEIVQREQARLRRFIRRSVADAGDAEDILQDIFYELVQAYRMMRPVEQAGAWLYHVARNRIVDFFRKKRPQTMGGSGEQDGNDFLLLEDLLPSPDAGPDGEYFRTILFEELDAAIEELPASQREVFIAHEMEGKSFQEMAEETGVSVNTLLSRKRYAVLHLRERLRGLYDDFLSR